MTEFPDSELLESMQSELQRIELAQQTVTSVQDSERLYERLLRYRRLVALCQNRERVQQSRSAAVGAVAN